MTENTVPNELSVRALKTLLDEKKPPIILDVRMAHEREIAKLPQTPISLHIPLDQLQGRLSELSKFKNEHIVVYCRSGGRSLTACSFLRVAGFSQAQNLTGGILAWSKEIDPSVPQY